MNVDGYDFPRIAEVAQVKPAEFVGRLKRAHRLSSTH